MKKIITMTVILFVFVNAYSFAERWNPNEKSFITHFERSDLRLMEEVLQENAVEMDLSACLYSVLFSYYPQEHKYILPINTNKRFAFDVIQMLIKYGADPNKYPAYYYCKDRANEAISAVDYTKADVRQYPLELAVEFNLGIQTIEYMLKSGADPYLYGLSSPFYNAIFNDNVTLTRLLIEHGISVNKPVIGISDYALSYAAAWGRYGIVKLLVDSGAKVNQVQMGFGEFGKTAAEIAYKWNEIDIYFFLKEHGAIYTAPGFETPILSEDTSQAVIDIPSVPAVVPGPSSSGFNYEMESPLENGIYRLSGGKLDKMRLTGVGKNGVISYSDPSGRILNGIYTTSKNTLIITVSDRIFYYIIISKTSFGGNGELWYRTGS